MNCKREWRVRAAIAVGGVGLCVGAAAAEVSRPSGTVLFAGGIDRDFTQADLRNDPPQRRPVRIAQESASRPEQEGKLPPPGPMAGQPKAKAQASAAGRYSILREGGKDTGCMLTLDTNGKTQSRGRASLAPGCRDQGIVIFDPWGWEMAGSRLVLVARKGHKAHLDAQPDGSWKKDAAEGKILSLKKL